MNDHQRKGMAIDKIDQFVELLLETLYELGLAPLKLNERPATFDKHPQELFAYLRVRERDPDPVARVDAAFQEWQTWLLRKVPPNQGYVKERAFLSLAELRRFMLENATLFDRRTLAHLRKSLYGRMYAYLYPRLVQIMAFKQYCKEMGLLSEKRTEIWSRNAEGGEEGEGKKEFLMAVSDPTFIHQHFAKGTNAEWMKMINIYGEERATAMREAAMQFLLDKRYWFNTVFADK